MSHFYFAFASKQVDIINKDGEKSLDDDLEENFVVEKIVGKRYNPKKKQVEYLLKWEGYPPEQNTWEPLSNLTTCKSLLQEYERSAALQLNDKSSATRYSGLLKKDNTISQSKLQDTSNSNKPINVISNKLNFVEKKVEPVTTTLQTQRKIVPVTPPSNNVTANKVAVPITSVICSESPKLDNTIKSASTCDIVSETSKTPKSPVNSAPFKKRVIPNTRESPLIFSPEKYVYYFIILFLNYSRFWLQS